MPYQLIEKHNKIKLCRAISAAPETQRGHWNNTTTYLSVLLIEPITNQYDM